MFIWAGKQISLCTNCLPSLIASLPPRGRGSTRKPCLRIAAVAIRQKARDTLGTRIVFVFHRSRVNFNGYGSESALTGVLPRFFLRVRTVSIKDFTLRERGPTASPSSSLRMRGSLLEISFIRRIISSVRTASWPHPKLTICTYSRTGSSAALMAPASILA
jgi:hypothetical protein